MSLYVSSLVYKNGMCQENLLSSILLMTWWHSIHTYRCQSQESSNNVPLMILTPNGSYLGQLAAGFVTYSCNLRFLHDTDNLGFLGGSVGKESTCQCRRCQLDPWVGKIPWRRKWQPIPVFLPGKSHGGGAWWAKVFRVTKSQTKLSNRAQQ